MAYKLLSVESDAKTIKGTKQGVLTGILYSAPATEADGVHNLCTFASPECREVCLYGAGMAGVFPSIKAARIAKTRQYLENPAAFRARLISEVSRLVREAELRGMVPAVRINGTSDLDYPAHLFEAFRTVQFYDYTKSPHRMCKYLNGTLPANYHLTFSFSGTNLADCMRALKHGVNVAVVFSGTMPDYWNGCRVINGDASDLRFTDEAGVIVGLKSKGTARKMATGGFIQIGEVA